MESSKTVRMIFVVLSPAGQSKEKSIQSHREESFTC